MDRLKYRLIKARAAADDDDSDADPKPPQPPKSQSPTANIDPSMVWDDEGKMWRDKFNGQKGAVQDLSTKLAEARREIDSLKQKMTDSLSSRDQDETQLREELESLRENAGVIPDLHEKIKELTAKVKAGERYKALARRPELLSMVVEEEEETEDGETVTKRTNPILDLVASSNLEGEDLDALLDKLSVAVPTTSAAEDSAKPPAPPAPPAPDGDDLESLYNAAIAADDALREHGWSKSLNDKSMQAWAAYREALAEQS
jgi:uncharacterized coiled-coil protein SlyX